MATSVDTLLRSVRARPLPTASTPTALGVDDWSFKRGSTYGTILVDLETRRVVDLLPDRRAETLAAWLRPRRRRVKVVARDRSTEFARGVEMGAPRAVQVADRWHLLKNTRERLTRWLFGVYGRLRRLPAPVAARPSRRGVRTRAFPRARTEQRASAASRARWIAWYQEVRRRQAAGESLRAIKRATGLARATVRRFARAESFPERALRAPGPSRLGCVHPLAGRAAGRRVRKCFRALPRATRTWLPWQQPAGPPVGADPARRPRQDHAAVPP